MTAMPDPATRYAEAVVAGKVVAGRLVRLACERHLRDLVSGRDRGLYYDPVAATRILTFGRKYCRFWEGGDFAGRPVTFEPWQQFILGSIYGWKRESGARRFQVSWVEVPKKNGKTTLAAVPGLYGLTQDADAGPQVYSVASRRDQASIVFNAARNMALKNQSLVRALDLGKTRIFCPRNDGVFMPLGADPDSIEGKNPYVAIVDEVHVIPTTGSWDNLRSAMASRRSPILFAITTAGDGSDQLSLYNLRRREAVDILEGAHTDDSIFAFIAALDLPEGDAPGDDWQDESVWIKANPNLGVSVQADNLRVQVEKARRSPADQNDILRKHFNIVTQARDVVIPMRTFRGCKRPDKEMSWEALRGRECFPGIDLTSRLDLAAIGYVFPPAGDDPLWRYKWDAFLPAVSDFELAEKSQVAGLDKRYLMWREQGWLTVTDSEMLDQSFIRRRINEVSKIVNVKTVGIDRHNAEQLANELMFDDGIPCTFVIQGPPSLNAATRGFIEEATVGAMAHDGNPVADWCAGNMAVRRNVNDQLAPDKLKAGRKIDLIVAAITGKAVALAHIDKAPKPLDYQPGSMF